MRIRTVRRAGATLQGVNGYGRWRSGVVLVCLLLPGCLQAGFGACSDEERAVFDSLRHFEDMPLVAQDHATGGCAARFQTTDPQAVIDHYESELLDGLWLIGTLERQPDGTPVEVPPGVLLAQKGDMSFSVEVPLEGGDRGTVTVLVGEGL